MKICILVVEDNDLSAEVLIKLLNKQIGARISADLEILRAKTLQEGLSLAHLANATILDLALPDSDPVNSANSIGMFQPPVIVLTGSADLEVQKLAKIHGAAHVCMKGESVLISSLVLDCIMKDLIDKNTAAV